jgi:nucleotide-binding universal stress UspA family protein
MEGQCHPDAESRVMTTKAIISYDDTSGDHDALALGALLSKAGVELVLAYVRHSTQPEEHEAEALLERGAQWLGDPDVARRVVVSGSTPEGLKWLAEHEDAALVVFGSDYRTPVGHVSPQHSAETLLEGGPPGLAIAPAGYAQFEPRIRTIGLLAAPGDDAALETARDLAESFEATVTRDEPRVDLLVVGSRTEAPMGTVMLSAQSERAIEDATAPVLVVPRAVPIRFPEVALTF